MTTPDDPTHVAIPMSRRWGYRLLAMGLLMIAGGVAGYLFNPPPISWICAAAGVLGVLIAGGVWPYFLNNPPAVESDGTGVTVRTLMVTVVRLPWSAIEGFEVVTLRNDTRWIGIRVYDPEGVAELWNPAVAEVFHKMNAEAQRATGRRYGALIPRHSLRADLHDAAERLNEALREARRRPNTPASALPQDGVISDS